MKFCFFVNFDETELIEPDDGQLKLMKNMLMINNKLKEKDMNYWVVGANWDSCNLADKFYLRGCWEMGYDEEEKPNYADKINRIKQGDRIAVKTRDGQGADTICIKAIGIVKDVHEGKVYVDWVSTEINRHVPCKNYFGTIHGPVTDETWRNEAFCL
jgi:hypothetical protein